MNMYFQHVFYFIFFDKISTCYYIEEPK